MLHKGRGSNVAGILIGKSYLRSYSVIRVWKQFSIGSVEDYLFHFLLHRFHNSSNTCSQMVLQHPNSTGLALQRWTGWVGATGTDKQLLG